MHLRQAKKTYGDCQDREVDEDSWIEIDKNKKVIVLMADDPVKTYQIKKMTVYSSSTVYLVSDESGMTWLYQIQFVKAEEHFELHVWQCDKNGAPVYILGKASVGI